MTMKLTLLGTGTPAPNLNRVSSSYLLEIGDDLILFDCGPGSYNRILESKYSFNDITHVFFSHFHYDHCADFAAIALTRWDHLAASGNELIVVGPNHTKNFIDKLFGENGAYGPDQDARTLNEASLGYFQARGGSKTRPRFAPFVHEISSGDSFDGNGWKLTCVEVPHAQPYLDCLGYRVDSAEQSFCYSGDSSYTEAFIKLAKDCDVMIHMCHRISGTELNEGARKSSAGHLEAAKIAEKSGAKKCVLTHLSEQMNVPGLPERLIKEIQAIYNGDVIWGQDLTEIPFGKVAAKALE
ncbi:MAG: MBL fold metallo-hydrolase [Blastopirellula sp.]|nr:MAG: MBL fold metallo-hydrolase [Blastopirellula sp.]